MDRLDVRRRQRARAPDDTAAVLVRPQVLEVLQREVRERSNDELPVVVDHVEGDGWDVALKIAESVALDAAVAPGKERGLVCVVDGARHGNGIRAVVFDATTGAVVERDGDVSVVVPRVHDPALAERRHLRLGRQEHAAVDVHSLLPRRVGLVADVAVFPDPDAGDHAAADLRVQDAVLDEEIRQRRVRSAAKDLARVHQPHGVEPCLSSHFVEIELEEATRSVGIEFPGHLELDVERHRERAVRCLPRVYVVSNRIEVTVLV
mmetsp:Transcript_35537/g.113587  ORF Transcript_35537/g.113587 Transcript_35537/m.113587 type:complete len:263 (-) Transcript_35537:969-1757(-)